MILPLLLFAADSLSAYAGPRPEAVATYKNWITGCDNERNCSAIALAVIRTNGTVGADHLEILIEQPLWSNLDPAIIITAPTGPIAPDQMTLFVDDTPIQLPPILNGRFVFHGPDKRVLLRRMAAGAWAEMRGPAGSSVVRTSLAGLTAALLRIDEQQGRVGTERALVNRGTRIPYDDLPGYTVSLTQPARSSRPPAELDATVMSAFGANDQCVINSRAQARLPIIARLDDEHTLLLMPWQCGNGAYNLYTNILIIDDYGQIRPAAFDYDNGLTGDGPSNVLVNATWNDSKRTLESFTLYRAIGDCGRIDQFIWSGEEFRLSEQRVMPECRGSFETIRVWKVGVVDK
jgi:hypothetical protein